MTSIPFTKVEGIGNHFVLVNALDMPALDWPMLARATSEHNFGVGSDGLLVLLPSDNADFGFRMFNPDGTEDMCGNGLRCIAVFIAEKRLSPKADLVFETRDGLRQAEIISGRGGSGTVRVNMGVPSLRAADIPMQADLDQVVDYPLEIGGRTYELTCVSVGSPHAVICAELADYWETIPPVSRDIEHHPLFPERINVTWCSGLTDGALWIRTWERGIGFTLGCGTGACAALVAAHIRGTTRSSALVSSPGGTLDIEWRDRGDLYMTGPARIVYEGTWQVQGR